MSSPSIAHRRSLARNLAAMDAGGRIAVALAEAGVDTVFYKGAALIELGVVPASRPMADVDLLIRRDQAQAARRALADLGAERVLTPGRPLSGRVLDCGEYRTAQDTKLDVHDRFDPHGRWPVDYPALFQRARPMTLSGHPVRRLDDTDLLLATMVGLAKDDMPDDRRRADDLAAMIDGLAIDWTALTRRAHGWRFAAGAWWCLHYAQAIGGARIPTAVLDGLMVSPGRRRLMAGLAAGHSTAMPRRLRQLAVAPLVHDRQRDLARATFRFLVLRLGDAVLDVV